MAINKRVLKGGAVRWVYDYYDQAGKRRYRQFLTKKEAVAYETKVRGEIAGGLHVAPASSITVSEAGDLWIARGEREGLEASTLRQYRQHLVGHICPLIGTRKLSDLTKPAVEHFRDRLLEDRSRALTRAVLTSLKGILNEAQRRGYAHQNVAADTGVKLSKRGKPKLEIPAKVEIAGMLSKAAELWPMTQVQTTRAKQQKMVPVPWYPLVVTAIFTGLRCSELRGLTWEHVDLQAGVIRVRQRADFRNHIGDPKSEAGNREIPLAPMALNTLKAWKLACQVTASGIVFPSENGVIHSTPNIHKQCWRPLLRALGLVSIMDGREEPKYRFHDLRHAAASLFIEDGWAPKKIQIVMGHSSIQVTFDTYGHLWKTAEDDAKAMARIEERLLREVR